MIRLKVSINVSEAQISDYFLYNLEWAKKYQPLLDKICNKNVDVFEVIATFARIPNDIDFTEPTYSYINSICPSALEINPDYLSYIIESLVEEYYRSMENIIKHLALNIDYEYLFIKMYDKTTALIEIVRSHDFRFNERLAWQTMSRLT
jgi:hypothetical protein